ncbi:MAG: T9SS type A sorting domain-containing protein [Saprospiraceae bacterium]
MKKIFLPSIIIFAFLLNSMNLVGQHWDYLYTPPVGQFINSHVTIDELPNGNMAVYSEGYTHLLEIDSLGNSTWQPINDIGVINSVVGLENFSKDNLIITADSSFILFDDNNNNSNQPTSVYQQLHIAKLDANLDTIWAQRHDYLFSFGSQYIVNDVKQLSDDNILVLLYDNNDDEIQLIKFDYTDGSIIWRASHFSLAPSYGLPYTYYGKEIVEHLDGTLSLLSQVSVDSTGYVRAMKLSSNGHFIWAKNYTPTREIGWADSERTLAKTFIGELIFSFREYNSTTNEYQTVVVMTDVAGNEIWRKPISQTHVYDLILTNNDEILVCGQAANNANQAAITKLDLNGTIIWDKVYLEQFGTTTQGFHFQRIMEVDNNRFFVAGMTTTVSGDKIYAAMIDSMGNTFTNIIHGTVYHDANNNCAYDANEVNLNAPILVRAVRGTDTTYTITDTLGNYSVAVPPGVYQIQPITFSNYWTGCFSPFVSLPKDSTALYDVGLQSTIDCSDLNVTITNPILIRCFSSTYYVNYANYGTLSESGVYIDVEIDTFITVDTTSIPYTQNGNIYTFFIGDLNINQTGQFTIDITVNCSATLGQAHCVEANIFPQQICLPNNTVWTDAEVNAEVNCIGNNMVEFKIENIGTQAMTQARQYHVIEEQILQHQGMFQLPPGNDTSWTMPAIPNTVYVLRAKQEFTHPNADYEVSDFAFGCHHVDSTLSIPINQFPLNDSKNYIDIDCLENVGSYDPNDKQGFPVGYGNNHYIRRSDEIEYMIRFQNTGTYLAFNVIVEDEIDTDALDLSTLKLQGSSHPFSLSIEDGKILKFLFLNIMLPDSNTNEQESHGFVRFRIGQKANNPLGTVIENSADIFFDFNAPIITNTTFHTVGEFFIQTVSTQPIKDKLANVKIFPNPFSEQTTIEVETDKRYKNMTLTVYNTIGQTIKTIQSNGESRMILDKNGLTTGIYFYQIQAEGLILDSGKLMVN